MRSWGFSTRWRTVPGRACLASLTAMECRASQCPPPGTQWAVLSSFICHPCLGETWEQSYSKSVYFSARILSQYFQWSTVTNISPTGYSPYFSCSALGLRTNDILTVDIKMLVAQQKSLFNKYLIWWNWVITARNLQSIIKLVLHDGSWKSDSLFLRN